MLSPDGMIRAQPSAHLSYEEYVAQEAGSAEKHEFLGGCVYAMAGGSPEHGALAIAFASELPWPTSLVGCSRPTFG